MNHQIKDNQHKTYISEMDNYIEGLSQISEDSQTHTGGGRNRKKRNSSLKSLNFSNAEFT